MTKRPTKTQKFLKPSFGLAANVYNEGFPGGSADKESTCNVGDLGSITGLGRSPGEGKGSTPVFWPGEFHGLYSPWGRKELDTTERLSLPLYEASI